MNRIINYMHLKHFPIQCSLYLNRTQEFQEVFHAHQGLEIVYVHMGKGQAVIGPNLIDIRPGTLLVFKPYLLHHVRVDTSPPHFYIRSMLLLEPSVMQHYLKPFPTLLAFLELLWQGSTETPCLQLDEDNPLENLIRVLGHNPPQLWKAHLTEQHALYAISLLTCIKELYERHAQGPNGNRQFHPSIVQIVRWLEENYHQELNLEELSEMVHLTPTHTSYLFHKETGIRLRDYLHSLRIREASFLLKTTTLPIREIGQRVGLINFANFCNGFKRATGLSPSQYRSF